MFGCVGIKKGKVEIMQTYYNIKNQNGNEYSKMSD